MLSSLSKYNIDKVFPYCVLVLWSVEGVYEIFLIIYEQRRIFPCDYFTYCGIVLPGNQMKTDF